MSISAPRRQQHRDQQQEEPPTQPPSWSEIGGLLFANLTSDVKAGIMIFLVVVLGGLGIALLIPHFLLPLAGRCHENEGIMDCHFRIKAEEEKLHRFEDCQRACGRATGSTLCLERCEYEYDMGKWQYAQTYTTATGNQFRCPQGEQGYEDTHGRGYCA
jgi:hypothetical protein